MRQQHRTTNYHSDRTQYPPILTTVVWALCGQRLNKTFSGTWREWFSCWPRSKPDKHQHQQCKNSLHSLSNCSVSAHVTSCYVYRHVTSCYVNRHVTSCYVNSFRALVFLFRFHWDISVIFPVKVSVVFVLRYFLRLKKALWPNWLNFFGHMKKI